MEISNSYASSAVILKDSNVGESSVLNLKKTSVTNMKDVFYVDNKKSLGQVFTPEPIAEFMVSIIVGKIKDTDRVLDPCIGPNTFFSILSKHKVAPQLVGLEVDKSLISSDVKTFFKAAYRDLFINSFLSYPLANKFDFIIQNPPYVRQELLGESLNSKNRATSLIPKHYKERIPSQSNLYVYFLIKSIEHLKDNGVMVAVIYDSWLYSSFGKALKDIMLEQGIIRNIYHIKDNAFPDAEVGATVIEFHKTEKAINVNRIINYYDIPSVEYLNSAKMRKTLKHVRIPEDQFLSFNLNEESCIDFGNTLFRPMKQLSTNKIQRGTSSVANGYFLHESKRFKESIPIIKDISKISSYVASKPTAYLLVVGDKKSEDTSRYLNTVKKQIVESGDKYKAVKNKILNHENWWKINLKKPGNFIFNYYIRNNVDFIFNEGNRYASDNFYILNVDNAPLAHLAILNSTFTRLAVLRKSRNQGNGLRKVQLYEFNDIPVMDISYLTPSVVLKLSQLGEELKNQDRYDTKKKKLISKIDKLMMVEYNRIVQANIAVEDLQAETQRYFS